MADYFDRVELHLLDAVGRRTLRRRHRLYDAGARLRRLPRGFALGFALVVVGASAATAAALLGQPSVALSGRVPKAVLHPPGGGAPIPYQVVVEPNLSPGDPGWGVGVELGSRRLPIPAGVLSGNYPSSYLPVIWDNPSPLQPYAKVDIEMPGGQASSVAAILTAGGVAAVRFGKEIIRTRSAPGLPAGDRIAVFFTPPSLLHPATPLAPVGTPQAIALAQDGHPLARAKPPALNPLGPQLRSWGPTRTSGAGEGGVSSARPLPGVCELAQRALPGLRAQSGTVISGLARLAGAEGEVLEPCLETVYTFQHSAITVALLLNGADLGSRPGLIPNAKAVRGDPGFVNVVLGRAPGGLTAELVAGKAWLVAQGGNAVAQRIAVLRALHVAKLDLGPFQLPVSGHALLRAEACLQRAGVSTSISGSFTNYPYLLTVKSLGATVGFYDTIADARGDLRNQRADAVLTYTAAVTRHGNATISWATKPTPAAKARLERCLR